MTKEVLLDLTPGEVERIQYAFREISDVYEDHYDGPRKAAAFKEYLIARQMVVMCECRLAELRNQSHGERIQD